MPTSQTFLLSKPTGADRISDDVLGYFRERNRNNVHAVVLNEFVHSGVTRADLARRLGKRPEQVTRLLGAPGNWTLDTVSDFLFAISGAEPVYRLGYPLDQAPRNQRQPEWLEFRKPPQSGTANTVSGSATPLTVAPKSINEALLDSTA